MIIKKYENDALFKIEIRKKFRELLNLGFTDVYRYINRNKQEFTFWDYTSGSWQKNNGLRIDHFFLFQIIFSKMCKISLLIKNQDLKLSLQITRLLSWILINSSVNIFISNNIALF